MSAARVAGPAAPSAEEGGVTPAAIAAAAERIAPYIRRTATVHSRSLSARLGAQVYLKLELLQRTGSFKARGAFNKVVAALQESGARGVVAVSGGNHGQGVADAAATLGVPAVIFMPRHTPAHCLDATRDYGAEVITTRSLVEGFAAARAYAGRGWTFVHPFDDPQVIAGQGTVGLEILADVPQVSDVLVSVGGGGRAGGVGIALQARRPRVRLWGVETAGADCMARALRAGRVVEMEATSIARTLGAPAVSARTLRLAQACLESVTVVSDAAAVQAMRYLLERTKMLAEPAAACTWAAAEALRHRFTPDSHVVLILCGGNAELPDTSGWYAPSTPPGAWTTPCG